MSCGKAVVVIGGGGAGGVRVRIGGVGMIDGGMGGGIGVVATAGGGRRERLIGGGRLVNPGVTLIEGRKLEIGLRGGERRLRDLGERETVDGERRFRDREMVEGDRLALEPVRAVAPSSPHVTTVSSPVRGGVDRSCYSWRSVNSRDDPGELS
ncbi:hypothetical protein Pcinc_021075 [Petrolisthes cinctipes]|uniref:Uncharacterized protein n=1 Tax=Petrolisthes cinctipes TaxID=88211 RepID=A0AAE1FIY7_PETCI|nr:hypothetical protein Pcinc_021075 [Petrolisthes cinctipes]